jgi:hypothetical protein
MTHRSATNYKKKGLPRMSPLFGYESRWATLPFLVIVVVSPSPTLDADV